MQPLLQASLLVVDDRLLRQVAVDALSADGSPIEESSVTAYLLSFWLSGRLANPRPACQGDKLPLHQRLNSTSHSVSRSSHLAHSSQEKVVLSRVGSQATIQGGREVQLS